MQGFWSCLFVPAFAQIFSVLYCPIRNHGPNCQESAPFSLFLWDTCLWHTMKLSLLKFTYFWSGDKFKSIISFGLLTSLADSLPLQNLKEFRVIIQENYFLRDTNSNDQLSLQNNCFQLAVQLWCKSILWIFRRKIHASKLFCFCLFIYFLRRSFHMGKKGKDGISNSLRRHHLSFIQAT